VILKTPNFTNKTASIIWMLLLALALVLVDYFLSPVMTENGWAFQKVIHADKKRVNSLRCNEKIKQYSQKDQEKSYIAKMCLNNSSVILIKESQYKGELLVVNNGTAERLASNIQLPKLITVNPENEIFIQEQGRNRILKFYKK